MKSLHDITLWACVGSEDTIYLAQTVRVLAYCEKHYAFGGVVLMTRSAPVLNGDQKKRWLVVQVPRMDVMEWNIFHVFVAPSILRDNSKTHFYLSVHEDGFPIDHDRFEFKFLEYDYIGAPWTDGKVGNGGFCIESAPFLFAKSRLPMMPKPLWSDRYVCDWQRGHLDKLGLRYAPADVAERFSTEQTGKQKPSWGFHGRRDMPHKYRQGWRLIEESEK